MELSIIRRQLPPDAIIYRRQQMKQILALPTPSLLILHYSVQLQWAFLKQSSCKVKEFPLLHQIGLGLSLLGGRVSGGASVPHKQQNWNIFALTRRHMRSKLLSSLKGVGEEGRIPLLVGLVG